MTNKQTIDGVPRECRECGSTSLNWSSHSENKSDVQEGRLRTHEVSSVFVLGCDNCSETLQVIGAEKIEDMLNKPAAQPQGEVERDTLQWRPYKRGENEPTPGVEVLVRYARQWPNDNIFFVTGALLFKAFDDSEVLFWFNGRGEAMSGTVSHWAPMPSHESALSTSAEPKP